MKYYKHWHWITFAFVMGAGAIALGEAPPIDLSEGYSAEIVTQAGGMTCLSRIYQESGKMRSESEAMGQKTISIMDQNKKIMWVLMPDTKTCMEMPIPPQSHGSGLPDSHDAKWEHLGDDTVNGQPAEKWKSIVTASGRPIEVFIWLRADNRSVLRTECSGVTTEWRNYKKGKQDPSLFEIPAGYTKQAFPFNS